ncbi:hypothetical protein B0A48_09037 [Cryoendolithus antarcticus]|uniref:Uncharacterized protein n=1 Tax=Cryoendolithus antarcticus TaxID=1507870 RepID=A0A1V8T1R3_9PEZI|nr:hypothetical protein B0A48_09037 [Cryoendolithus antarcticus]
MTDSPAFRAPLDPAEQPILDSILTLRDKLSLLKQDRSTYVKSQDVISLYNALLSQVSSLNALRENKRTEQNRVDTVLDDCFQLISLFFLTIGRNNEAPAVYSAVSTVKRLLDHLAEAKFYSPTDLDGIEGHIVKWEGSVERHPDDSEHMITLLKARIAVCKQTLQELRDGLSRLDPQMLATYQKLVSILRSLSACNTRSRYPEQEVKEFEAQLLEIQDGLHETRDSHVGQSAEEVYADRLAAIRLTEGGAREGDVVVKSLLARCLLWCEIVQEKKGKIDDRFEEVYTKLLKIRNNLEQMNLTHAWSLRETDLYSFQRQLDRIDESRVEGNFLDALNRPADLHAQRTLLYLLRKSYAFIYQYIVSSEPVSEALLPIYNQLLTLKRCLVEVQNNGGVDSPRELYPYSMKLNSIDNMKKDGAFRIGDEIPEGQGSCISLLAECFEMAYELRTEAQEKEEEAEERAQAQTNGGVEVGGN